MSLARDVGREPAVARVRGAVDGTLQVRFDDNRHRPQAGDRDGALHREAACDVLDHQLADPVGVGRLLVAEHHHLRPLQPHDPERLRPAAVVADAHADDRINKETPQVYERVLARLANHE